MKAKLPSLREPGFVTKQIVPVLDHGELTFWSLTEEGNEPYRAAYVVINELLFEITSVAHLKSLIENGQKVPSTQNEIVALLQDAQRNSDSPMSTHRLKWEALELPMDEWASKVEKTKQKRAARKIETENREREESSAKEEKEKKALEEASEKVRSSDAVAGELLLELAKKLGIDVNPRTAGVLKRMHWVSETQASGKKSSSQGIWVVYNQVKVALG